MTGARPLDVLSRRETLLGAAMLVAAGVAWARTPRVEVVAIASGAISRVIPTAAGEWRPAIDEGMILPPEDEQKAAGIYEEQVLRTFVQGDDPAVMLVIAYDRNQSGMLMVHRPESCYPGSGFTITADRPVLIRLAPGLVVRGRFLSTQRDARIEQVLYWTRLGNQFPQTWDEERRFLALQNLRGLAPDGALVRMSTIDPDPDAAFSRLTRLAADLFAASGRDGRALMGGPANALPGKA